MKTGRLSVTGSTNNKKIQLSYINSKGQYVQSSIQNIPEDQISIALTEKIQQDINQLKNLQVEFEEEGDQVKKLKEKGQEWDREEEQLVVRSDTKADPLSQNLVKNTRGDFHNPYNFVPAPPRNTQHLELRDHKPAGHGSYRQDYWSGRISVTLTTATPLLIPDAANATEDNNNHKTFPIRVGVDGKPYLPPTSIKGMLRSAYEAVTNSRFGIFEKHEDRLAYRMPPNIGLQMIPARIENGKICLYPGTSEIGNDGKPRRGQPMYAAWLERYDSRSDRTSRNATQYPDNSLPQHGQKVTAWLEEYEKTGNNGRALFQYWKVRKIVPFGQDIGPKPQKGNNSRKHQSTGKMQCVDGYVCITNKNIDNKHDERVFFNTFEPIEIELLPDLKKKWQELITNYQEIHENEIDKGINCPPALQRSKWSRHVIGGERERSLNEGTLCYARVADNGNDYKVLDLYPVMIARGLYEVAPDGLLPDNLKPATSIDDLSPSDRIFGWVKQKGKGSYKGNVRIHRVNCLSESAIIRFGNSGFPLAILGEPKEQQARFYQADDKQGTPLEDGLDKEEGYCDEEQGLRGRKVYPHHRALPEGHWDNPTEDRTQQSNNGHYQEYRRPKLDNAEQRDDQNRSIQAWVKPDTNFQFTIDITNLSNVELGALLWLLSLPSDFYHRLGGGKPLGFGSVHLAVDWDNTDLRTGQDWQQYYSSLLPLTETLNPKQVQSCIEQFKTAVAEAYGSSNNFDQVSFIAAFCRAAKGFEDNLPIHYPRTQAQPHPESKIFDWFVDNESTGNDGGEKVSLPSLECDRGLPLNPR